MAFEILCYVTVVFIVLYYYFTAKFNFWKDRSVRGPKPIPVFGNIFWPMIGKISIAEYLQKLHNEYKDEPMIGLFVRRTPHLVIQDPELIKDVLIKDFSKFANRGFLKQEIAEPLSQHLFSLEVERWRPLRMQFSPVFTSAKLKGIFSLILECAQHIESYLDILIAKGELIEMRELAARYTTDVIGSCAFGIEMNSLSDKESEFRRMGKEIFATHWKGILKFRMKECMGELYDLLGYILPPDKVNVFIERITIETLNYRKEHNIVRHDFMNTLLELRNNPEKIKDIKLTDTLLAAQAFIFFAAGFETSSSTISHALYELALNQEIQKKLREEIKEFDTNNSGDWKYETIKQMTYLDKVFKETLRKYPPLAFISRETTDNYTFSNTKVSLQKCMRVWIPVFSIHRDPNIYPDPDKFDPERFSKEAEDARHPMHYLPFGHGPRNCIGARFAIYQTKIGLIKILRNYEVHVCEKTPIPYELNPFAFIICPKEGLYLNIIKSKN